MGNKREEREILELNFLILERLDKKFGGNFG